MAFTLLIENDKNTDDFNRTENWNCSDFWQFWHLQQTIVVVEYVLITQVHFDSRICINYLDSMLFVMLMKLNRTPMLGHQPGFQHVE